jgi:hypothetical protein
MYNETERIVKETLGNILRNTLIIRLEGLKKIMREFRTGRDLNQILPEYKTSLLQ